MSARESIAALIDEYAAAVDAGDFDRLGRLFEDGVLVSPRGEARGAEAVAAWYRSVKLDEHGSPGTWHHVFGVDIDLAPDGSAATAHSYIAVVQDQRLIVGATYDDEFVLDGRGWRFAVRRVSMDLIGDLSGHLDLRQAAP
jgi:hypothetical protein